MFKCSRRAARGRVVIVHGQKLSIGRIGPRNPLGERRRGLPRHGCSARTFKQARAERLLPPRAPLRVLLLTTTPSGTTGRRHFKGTRWTAPTRRRGPSSCLGKSYHMSSSTRLLPEHYYARVRRERGHPSGASSPSGPTPADSTIIVHNATPTARSHDRLWSRRPPARQVPFTHAAPTIRASAKGESPDANCPEGCSSSRSAFRSTLRFAQAGELTRRGRRSCAGPTSSGLRARRSAAETRLVREWIARHGDQRALGQGEGRAAFVERLLRAQKSVEVRYDAAGNLVATRRGRAAAHGASRETRHGLSGGLEDQGEVRQGASRARLGGDNAHVVACLAALRALDSAGVKTKGDCFPFTVEERRPQGREQFVKDKKGRMTTTSPRRRLRGLQLRRHGINWYRHQFVGPGGQPS